MIRPGRSRPIVLVALCAAVALAGCSSGGGGGRPSTSSTGSLQTSHVASPTDRPTRTSAPTAPPATRPSNPRARPTRTPSSSRTQASSSAAHSSPAPSPTCVTKTVAALNTRELAGQLLLVGVDTTGLSASTAAILRSRDVGSVFLVGNSTAGVAAIRRLTDAVRATADRHTGMLVAADQEGGLVQRLQGSGFDRIPSAIEQASLGPTALRTDSRRWGAQLARAGVDLDLAPVADVVPASLGTGNAPIGALHRGYGANPQAVSADVDAFIAGMRAAGRGTTVKHFPGLGRVRGNTDYAGNVIDDQTSRHDPDLAPFVAAVRARVPVVMISLATYTRIDSSNRAVFSPTVITTMLRGDLGFHGVVVSDDLGAAAEVAAVPAGQRALLFLGAGGDLITVTAPAVAAQMSIAIQDRMHAEPTFAAAVRAKVARVLTLKQQLGLLPCR